jgi:murein DD-endopeptidase MepM/ murein hydrolase activator NlpD
VRSFPSAPSTSARSSSTPSRSRRLAALAVGVAAIGSFAVPYASADDDRDDLHHQQHQVENQIDKVRGDLDEASHAVAQATRRLHRAHARLGDARQRLQRVRADLWDARAERERLARVLVRAEARLDRVARELRAAQADVAEQRDLLRTTVLGTQTETSPELAVLDAITSSGSIKELMIANTAGAMVVGREDQALEAFQAAEDALAEWKDEVRAARDTVAANKEAARQNLLNIRALFTSARDTRAEVAQWVGRSRHARKVAVNARKRDRAALERLKSREDRIKRQLLALAQQHHGGPTYNGSTDGLLQVPTSGPVTSPFGWRTHPIYGYWGLHNGTDFGAPCGAALWAGESGTVINEYYDEVYGNRLYLSVGTVNGANLTLVYNHMSSYNVSEGAHVGRGDVVGYVGSTGWSTGCHLHFTVLRNGEPVDPMNYL